MKIAVIGGGVAGISSALLLHKKHSVTLFEKKNYVGGHTNTIEITEGPDAGTLVDTGFIVCNDRTYTNFHKMLKVLGASVRPTDMSFGFFDETTGYCYSGKNINGLFAQRRNIFRPRFWILIKEILRFYRVATRDLKKEKDLKGITMGAYLKSYSFSKPFIMDYLVPMGGAIWSSSNKEMLEFPAELFLHFFQNHGLINLFDRPQWQTVTGGSFAYVKKFITQFQGEIQIDVSIDRVVRGDAGVTIKLTNGDEQQFDKVIFACHADQVLNLIGDVSDEEKQAFQKWDYIPNHTVLHTDSSVLPANKRAWSSWNFTQEKETGLDKPISLSYDMNNLQGLKTEKQYVVTLNRIKPIPEEHIIREINYKHPNFTIGTLASRKLIRQLNGQKHSYFVGSYMGYGFHEDAVKSSVDVMKEHFGSEGFA